MAQIIVTTDDGKVIDRIDVDDDHSNSAHARMICGMQGTLGGALGRALSDARIVQRGGDPERPSEKAMRLLAMRERNEFPVGTEVDLRYRGRLVPGVVRAHKGAMYEVETAATAGVPEVLTLPVSALRRKPDEEAIS